MGKNNIFKLATGNESLHQDSNDNGVRIANFATSKTPVIKSTMFQHRNFHKYAWTSPDWKTHNYIEHILIERRWHLSVLGIRSIGGAGFDIDHCLVVANVRTIFAVRVSHLATQKFDEERFNLRKLNKPEVRKQYKIKISNRFLALENF